MPLLGPKKVNQGRITLVQGIGDFPRKSLLYISWDREEPMILAKRVQKKIWFHRNQLRLQTNWSNIKIPLIHSMPNISLHVAAIFHETLKTGEAPKIFMFLEWMMWRESQPWRKGSGNPRNHTKLHRAVWFRKACFPRVQFLFWFAPTYVFRQTLREGGRYQLGWIFRKVPKGGMGLFSIQKFMLQILGALNMAFLEAWD